MVRVGVIGLGMMGLTHLDAYGKRKDVTVTAIADRDPKRLSGEAQATGNVEGQAQSGVAALDCKRYDDADALIADPDVDLVDICLPTHMHKRFAIQAMEAGKHVMIEKPLARTAEDAQAILDASRTAKGKVMVGMCMRFWPGWTWLKKACDQKTYGKLLSATFRRVASHPGGPFYESGEMSGGALLDLHIHDTDFVHFLLGPPKAVSSAGYRKVTNEIDHVVTRYLYDDGPMVVAEGGWVMAKGFPFNMSFTANFEQATAVFDLSADDQMVLYEGGKRQPLTLDSQMGYDLEIAYLLDCIQQNKAPSTVTLQDAVNTIRIIEAEGASVDRGEPVDVRL